VIGNAPSQMSGVIAAIPTPVDATGEPDHSRFLLLARHLLANGCDGLNVLGTTGEATSLTLDQRLRLMSAAAAGLPTDRLMVGTGAAAVGDAALLTRHAEELGFAGALVLPPFYYKGISHDGVVRYIEQVAQAAQRVPLFLYHFPALSGVPFEPSLVERLLQVLGDRIAGLKDSSGDLTYARRLAALNERLRVFPSSEATLIEAREGVFAGCISATASLSAKWCARAFHQGDEAALSRAIAIRKLLEGLPMVPGVKCLLAHMHSDPQLAEPLAPLCRLILSDTLDLTRMYQELASEEPTYQNSS